MPLRQECDTKWLNYQAEEVRTGVVDGVRLVVEFNKDFKKIFNREVCITCKSDFKKDFEKYINIMSAKNEDYKLKPRYNGIPLGGFGSRVYVTNNTITAAQAKKLAKEHPLGKELFEKFKEETKKAK